ncbi:serine/threonine-protein kinase [Rhodopirellula sp. SWK7]|uniref:serine/threonine-protein kinase n=1 Tax=Rhodopirellula sp. SWK7 TaxID=595460 RepID=UPI0002BED30D|nr:serine/threonine-protein kinase [Rhodopirellula sp. SWK7]EMI46600.1 serine/threonine protein kinase with PASTA sensor(s) [Rhodopirellula sp. SWK7]
MSDLIGCRIGDYQVLRRLGSGGMADVYAARQLTLQRDVALKVLKSVTQNDDDHLKRFRREAQAAARLNHPSIVQIYEFGEVDDVHYISQELVDGINLKQALDREGPFSAEQAIEVLRSVASALELAHQSGVTHRDIKPENIMRGNQNTIKVTDFGLARMLTQVDSSTANLTRAGLTLGTPRYMSPEQIQGQTVDARSDLYSLGVTMYHLLTGSPPYEADEPLALAIKHLHDMPRPMDHVRGSADLPAWLVSLVMRCLQKSPDARFESAEALLEAIDAHAPAINTSGSSRTVVSETAVSSGLSHQPSSATSGSTASGKKKIKAELSLTTPDIGVSSATLQLQRATDLVRASERRRNRRSMMYRTAIVLSMMVFGVAGWAAARASRPDSLSRELRGPMVATAKTIEHQYLTALTRNDVPAWRAVLEYPAEPGSPQEDYHDKATLQLARLLIEQQEYEDATRLLNELEGSSSVDRLYLILAMVHRHAIAMATNNAREASRLKTQIADKLSELSVDKPAAAQLFNRIVPESERLAIGLVSS